MAYVSKYAIADSTGGGKETFTMDTDTFKLQDNLLILGVQAHWAKTKMMPQADEWMADYQRKMGQAVGIDNGGRTIGGGFGRGPLRGPPYYPLWRS